MDDNLAVVSAGIAGIALDSSESLPEDLFMGPEMKDVHDARLIQLLGSQMRLYKTDMVRSNGDFRLELNYIGIDAKSDPPLRSRFEDSLQDMMRFIVEHRFTRYRDLTGKQWPRIFQYDYYFCVADCLFYSEAMDAVHEWAQIGNLSLLQENEGDRGSFRWLAVHTKINADEDCRGFMTPRMHSIEVSFTLTNRKKIILLFNLIMDTSPLSLMELAARKAFHAMYEHLNTRPTSTRCARDTTLRSQCDPTGGDPLPAMHADANTGTAVTLASFRRHRDIILRERGGPFTIPPGLKRYIKKVADDTEIVIKTFNGKNYDNDNSSSSNREEKYWA